MRTGKEGVWERDKSDAGMNELRREGDDGRWD